MRLGIVSDAHHYFDQSNRLCTLSLLARQFEQWAGLFEEVIICAPLLPGVPPETHTPYIVNNVRLLPVTVAGGNTLSAKIDLLKKSMEWWITIHELFKHVDAIHIRCPNNISILGLLMLHRSNLLRQAVYTGSWIGHPGDAITYRLQRWFLMHYFRGPVAVYGEWLGQPAHIVSSFSPSYKQSDWDAESEQVSARLIRLRRLAVLPQPVHLLSVGALNKNKNQVLILQALRCLVEQGIDCTLDLLGDGDQRAALEDHVTRLNLAQRVFFHGNVGQSVVRKFYRQSDFVIQAPYSEGFGKVPIEAFFHGVIPILSDVDMSSQITGMGARGFCFPQGDTLAIVHCITNLIKNPVSMAHMIEAGRQYALGLTLEAWQQHLCEMLSYHWKTELKISHPQLEK